MQYNCTSSNIKSITIESNHMNLNYTESFPQTWHSFSFRFVSVAKENAKDCDKAKEKQVKTPIKDRDQLWVCVFISVSGKKTAIYLVRVCSGGWASIPYRKIMGSSTWV